jgi:hypothetical protein
MVESQSRVTIHERKIHHTLAIITILADNIQACLMISSISISLCGHTDPDTNRLCMVQRIIYPSQVCMVWQLEGIEGVLLLQGCQPTSLVYQSG